MEYIINPLHRKIKMLGMIPREPGYITASIIHERFQDQGINVDVRTIQRDLQKLIPDFPITYYTDESTKTNLWFFIKDSTPFDIPALSPITALSFNLVERFLKDTLPGIVTKQLSPHFNNAEEYLKKMQSSSWLHWSEKVRFVPKGNQLLPPRVEPEIFEAVTEGLWRGQQLKISYKSRDAKKASESIIHPLGLAFRFGAIYLLCTFWNFEDIRQMALHRFQKVELLSDSARVPKGFNFDEYIGKEEFSYPTKDKPIKIKLLFNEGAAYHLYESKLSEDQVMEVQADGNVLLTATVKETSELHWWLRGFGDGVEVLEPREMREEFTENANKLAQMYSANP
jgi:predicted DNA-binding transcriptional regulator YafY